MRSKLAQHMYHQANRHHDPPFFSLTSRLQMCVHPIVKVYLTGSESATIIHPLLQPRRVDSSVVCTLTSSGNLTKHSFCGAFRHVPTQGWSAALCVTAYHIMKLFLFFFFPSLSLAFIQPWLQQLMEPHFHNKMITKPKARVKLADSLLNHNLSAEEIFL